MSAHTDTNTQISHDELWESDSDEVTKTMIRRDKAIKYFRLAKIMANIFSKDNSTKVGSLFIAPKTYEIMSLGYNGMPRGVNEKILSRWERPMKYDLTEHAERNALYNAARTGTKLTESICVVTMFPCCDCARGIIQSGAQMVISMNPYKVEPADTIKRWKSKWDTSIGMLKEAGLKIMFLTEFEMKMFTTEISAMHDGLIKPDSAPINYDSL